MKRDEAIVPLSRDHHTALLFCWKIRQALKMKVSVSRIAPYILYFWQDHLQTHFDEEENIVFVIKEDAYCQKAVMEHRQIEKMFIALNNEGVDEILLQKLTDALDHHIRFEERVLFPHLERQLSADQLKTIGNMIHQSHHQVKMDEYKDEFWKQQKH